MRWGSAPELGQSAVEDGELPPSPPGSRPAASELDVLQNPELGVNMVSALQLESDLLAKVHTHPTWGHLLFPALTTGGEAW